VPTITQDHLDSNTPLGANLTGGGATFRVWAPGAAAVHLKLNTPSSQFQPGPGTLLTKDAGGFWGGFVAGVHNGDAYRYFVVGPGGKGFKRDPFAREMGLDPAWPDCDCLVRDPDSYPWHDQGFRPPSFSDLIIYQFHIGTYYATNPDGSDRRATRGGTFLDVLFKLPHLLDLGVNALEPLPIVEFESDTSMGYNGSDLFSPEMRYAVTGPELDRYLDLVNGLLRSKGRAPLTRDQLGTQVNQLKAFMDVCHLFGLAVLFDVVYNHAGAGAPGGQMFDDQSLYFLDFQVRHSDNDSLYFTDHAEAGGRVFNYQKAPVRQFLVANAQFFYDEYHVDGFRFDEVTVIDQNSGWGFCQQLTDALRSSHPERIQIAEYWRPDPSWVFRPRQDQGAGFDAVWSDVPRNAIRDAVRQAATAFGGALDLGNLHGSLAPRFAPGEAWRSVNCVENHDLVYSDHPEGGRVTHLADATDARSWYATSRSRVATALLVTAPGVPMLFMGQELLEYRPWNDNLRTHSNDLVHWNELGLVKAVGDFLLFTKEAVALRRRLKGLRSASSRPYHNPGNRVIAFHRWVEWEGWDVIVVASLSESTFSNYVLGFPRSGRWVEVFNSDLYENHPNPHVAGNGGSVDANGPGTEAMPYSATIVIPANSVLVFVPAGG
jgi:1,4-alpha-glucan branching enzyme